MPPTPYALTAALDPATGDAVLEDGRRAHGEAPMLQCVLRILRTVRGEYAYDPTFGVDYSVARKASPGTAAAWRGAVIAALEPLVRRGSITRVQVSAELSGERLLYEVTFADPRQPGARVSTGRLEV